MAAERKPPLRWMTSPFLMDSFIFVRRFIRLLKWRLGKEQIRFGFLWPSHLPGPNPKWCLVLLKKCTLALSRPRLVECSNLQRGQIDGNSKVFQAGPQTENIMLLLPLGWCGNCTDADTDVEAMLMLVIQLFSYSELIQSYLLLIFDSCCDSVFWNEKSDSDGNWKPFWKIVVYWLVSHHCQVVVLKRSVM